MAFHENPRAFFGDFGVDATLDGQTVRGLFVAPYGEAFGMVAGSRPQFLLDAAVPAGRGDTLVMAGTAYDVAEIHGDGSAILALTLEAQ